MPQTLFTLNQVICGGAVAAVLLGLSGWWLYRLSLNATGISAIILKGRDAMLLLCLVFAGFAFAVESYRFTAFLGDGQWFFLRNMPAQIGYIVCAAIFALFASERIRFSESFTSSLKAAATAFAYLAFVPALFAVSFFWLEFAQYFLGLDLERQKAIDIFSSIQDLLPRICAVACICVLAPLSEELIFRSIMYRSLKWLTPPAVAAVIVALAFAMIHASIFAFPALFLFSILLTLLYERCGNIVAPIVLHAIFNLINVAALVFEPQIYELLSKNA